jgi:hypothetical protein
MERYFIRLNNTISPNGYNLTFGGENPVFTEEECIRRSERRKTINNRIASGLPAFKKRASNG